MKRIITIVILALTVINHADAGSVSPQKAQNAAVKFFSVSSSTKAGGNVRLVWDGKTGDTAQTKSSEECPFYVFARDGGGFVIIAGDDRMKPLLGYSYEGTFNSQDIPDGVKWWADVCKCVVNDIKSGKSCPDTDAARAWKELEIGTKATAISPAVLLKTAEWGQGEPFNNKCPMIGTSRALTGCVATSCAIMMRYLKYPSAGYGTVNQYMSGSITIPAHSLGSYDWDKMPTTYYGMDDDEKEAVAQLMYDCGTALFSTYGTSETSASTVRIQPAMSEYFKFSKYSNLLRREDYGYEQWTSMLKETLDKDYPVLYQGIVLGGGGGHAFIIDGYDSMDNFHFNWGWKGEDNGYFTLFNSYFSAEDSGVFNLWKDENWTSDAVGKLTVISKGLTASTPYIEKDKSFNLYASLYNYGQGSYTGQIKAVHAGADGTVKDVLGTSTISGDGIEADWGYSLTMSNIKVSKTIENGDVIRLVYTTSSGDMFAVGNKYDFIPLGFSLLGMVSLEYDKFSGDITLSGPCGMSYSFNGSSDTASSHTVSFKKPSKSGTYPLVISNGHESKTINLTF